MAGDTGEQALLVTRKNGWIDTLFDARSEAVCRSAALADDGYCSIVAKGRLAIDAETARRLVRAIGTEPPPLSDTDDFSACRARHAAGCACEAARVKLVITGPAYADAVRLELKEFTNHPEFSTFDRLCDTWHGTSWRAWFVRQLMDAPGGPPAWMQPIMQG